MVQGGSANHGLDASPLYQQTGPISQTTPPADIQAISPSLGPNNAGLTRVFDPCLNLFALGPERPNQVPTFASTYPSRVNTANGHEMLTGSLERSTEAGPTQSPALMSQNASGPSTSPLAWNSIIDTSNTSIGAANASLPDCRSSSTKPRNSAQSVEAQLSSICVDFSAALDLCDPARVSGSAATVQDDADDRSQGEGESQLLALFVRAQDAWTQIEEMGQARIARVRQAIDERRSNGRLESLADAASEVSSGRDEPGTGQTAKQQKAKQDVQKPLSTAGSMLALSLSFQMLDALRLLDGLLEKFCEQVENSVSTKTGWPTGSVASRASCILSQVKISSEDLPNSLLLPFLTSLHDHYAVSLEASLRSVISHARDWHEYEGQGCGPHHFCAVQVQGERVVDELVQMRHRADNRSRRRASSLGLLATAKAVD